MFYSEDNNVWQVCEFCKTIFIFHKIIKSVIVQVEKNNHQM